ncbi:MAG: M90 family metallopeptidase [Caldimonas sp.]
MPSWLDRWAAWRRSRTLANRAIPDALWQSTLVRFPFLGRRTAASLIRLREMATLFLAEKEFTGVGGLEVTDDMAVAIAAQACVPVLELGLHRYAGFVGIVVHADAVAAHREVMDDAGVVHQYVEELSGEAMEGGPLMLSWSDVSEAGASAAWGYNVVIHEFVHVLDMQASRADTRSKAEAEGWAKRLAVEFERFVCRVDAGEDTLLDPYGAEAIEEFFAVAAEAFFVAPDDVRAEEPLTYDLLSEFFCQSPADSSAEASTRSIAPSPAAAGALMKKGSRSSL